MTAADNSPEDLPNNSAAKGTEPAGSREPSSPISHRKPRKRKKLLIVLCVVLAILFALTAAAFVALKIGEGKLRKRASGNPKLPSIDTEEMPEDADAYYQGEAYFYNHNLINLLLIGIDRADPETNTSHQADALYFFSLDTATNHANVLAISRNTMADVAVYDIDNRYLSTQKQQICMAYSYGKTPTQSAELTVQAVSDFLCGVPISGYYAVYMDAVPAIVDAVGGVRVTIDEDMTRANRTFKRGKEVVLTGKTALDYLQFRNESNQPRLERQKTFLKSFVSQAKSAVLKNLSLPVTLYKEVASKTVTNVSVTSVAYFASEAKDTDVQFRSIQGTSGFDGFYETFEADENQLYLLLLDVFYKKQ